MSGDGIGAAAMVVVPAPATAKAAADRFTGDVWVDAITNGAGLGRARLATVRFSPGARTAWHRHAHGQTLHVTSGVGIVQTSNGQTIVMRPGDTVYTPPGVWHWHGALPENFMTHLALADSSAEPGAADVDWGRHVTNAEYVAATTEAATAERTTR